MNNNLKPCPKCGGKADKQIHGVSYIITCEPCKIMTKPAVMYMEQEVSKMHDDWNNLKP